MTKYLYISYIKWTAKVAEKGNEYYMKEWMPNHDKLAKEIGLKLTHRGTPFGVPEDSVWIYEGDTSLEDYSNFRGAVGRLEAGTIDWVTTTIVSLNP